MNAPIIIKRDRSISVVSQRGPVRVVVGSPGPRGRTGEGLGYDEEGTFAGRDAFDDEAEGFKYASTDGDGDTITTTVVFRKNSASSADWGEAVPLQSTVPGPAGDPAVVTGTSTTSLAVGTGEKVFTTQAGIQWATGQRLRAASAADVTNFMEGTASYSGTTLTLNVTLTGGSGTLDDWNIGIAGQPGQAGSAGVSGTSRATTVRVLDSGATDPDTDYEAGDTIDGVVLVQNDLILRASATDPELNGIYVASAAGAAPRHDDFGTFNDHPGTLVTVQEGTANADTQWMCTSDMGGTIDNDPLEFSEFEGGGAGGDSALSPDVMLTAMMF
jgi:hypothetical protein